MTPKEVNDTMAVDAEKYALEPLKLVAIAEINSPRIEELRYRYRYYKNRPPFPILDQEDPEQEKPRVAVGLAKSIVKKRSGFLFGADKFPGPQAIEWLDPTFGEFFQKVWDSNRCDGKILSLSRDLYWAGFAAWKVVVQPMNARKPVRLVRVKPDTLYCEFLPGEDKTKDSVKSWIIMYEREDHTFYREEIYRDVIAYYEGVYASDKEAQVLGGAPSDSEAQYVKFVLVRVEENDLSVFPLIYVSRDDEDDIWGECVYANVIDRVDRLNEMYTNAMFATAKIADPVLWLKGVKDTQEVHKDSDAVWFFENDQAAMNVLQWTGVPESTMQLIRKLTAQTYEECDLPVILKDTEQNIGDVPSRTLEILYTDLKTAVQQDRSSMSDWFYDLAEALGNTLIVTKNFGKDLGKKTEEAPAPTSEAPTASWDFERINWGTVIPIDQSTLQTDVIQLYNAKLVDGVTALQKLGYTEDEAKTMLTAIYREEAARLNNTIPDFADQNKDGYIDSENEDLDEDLE